MSSSFDAQEMSAASSSANDESEVVWDHWEPAEWRSVLENIRTMRSARNAPVDSMGAHSCADPTALPEVQRFQILVALMLSSQTKDHVTSAAMERLKTHGCTVETIVKTTEEQLAQLIYPVGFYKRKAAYIHQTAQLLQSNYNSDIPATYAELIKLPGVGPKMAHLAMSLAWDIVTGISVDTHVHRVSNRLGWVKKPTSTPEATHNQLEDWLPKELWRETNHLLVGFGQQICQPIRPHCDECLNKPLCPYAKSGSPTKLKRKADQSVF